MIRVVKTRALLDHGSTRTFCARRLINQLDITGDDADINLETLSDQKIIAASWVTLAIKGRNTKGKPILLHKVLAVDGFPKLESGIVSQEEVGQWDHLFDIVDQQDAGSDSEVLLLIGQDHPETLRPLEIRRGGDQEPYAIRTTLGWTINGPIGSCNVESCISAFIDATDVALDKQVGRFWEIDTDVSRKEIQMSVEDKEVAELWERQACLNDDHYVLPIPFKSSPPELPDNRRVAERRLGCLGRRLIISQDLEPLTNCMFLPTSVLIDVRLRQVCLRARCTISVMLPKMPMAVCVICEQQHSMVKYDVYFSWLNLA